MTLTDVTDAGHLHAEDARLVYFNSHHQNAERCKNVRAQHVRLYCTSFFN